MSNETELRAFERLEREGELARSQVPASIRRGRPYGQLLEIGTLREVRKGAGRVVRVEQAEKLTAYLNNRYPNRASQLRADAVANVARYRNSKGGRKEAVGVVLLRGQEAIQLNNRLFDLSTVTNHFGLAAAIRPHIQATRICLVENLDTFMRAERLLGPGWTLLHTYGRLGADTLTGLEAERILHFADFDYTGLGEYLLLKRRFPRTEFYLPADLNEVWTRYSCPLKSGVRAPRSVIESRDEAVVRVRSLLMDTGKFLEQQALFIDLSEPS
jgi:hypothetical protein